MLNIDLMHMIASLGGYKIDNTADVQESANKTRSQLRVNAIKAHIVGMFGGHWPKNWKEGQVGLSAPYTAGTVTITNGSRTVTGDGTLFDGSIMNGSLIQLGTEYYRIAIASSTTQLFLTTPFQGVTRSGLTYQIWKDRYRLYPDVFAIDDALNFIDPARMSETWAGNIRDSFPSPTQNAVPRIWAQMGNVLSTASYSTGTISGSVNSTVLTGTGTSWLSNLEPGWDITIGSTGYRVFSVDSDTQVTLYQMLKTAVAAGTTYTAIAKNSLRIRFATPTAQQLVSYGYFSKDWPFVNDNDSDWISESYPNVMVMGATWMDYLDKNDTVRARQAQLIFDNAIRDIHVAEHMNYTGLRSIGYNIPAMARE